MLHTLKSNIASAIDIILLTICYLFLFSLVDRIGRKPLLSASALGTGMSLLIFGVFAYITSLGYETSEYHWVPIVTFSLTFFIAACGILPLLTVIISEFMPDKVSKIKYTQILIIIKKHRKFLASNLWCYVLYVCVLVLSICLTLLLSVA